jgi:hypothetical protein
MVTKWVHTEATLTADTLLGEATDTAALAKADRIVTEWVHTEAPDNPSETSAAAGKAPETLGAGKAPETSADMLLGKANGTAALSMASHTTQVHTSDFLVA